MSTARPDRFAMTTLRGDLPAASVLAVLFLLVQVLAGGLGPGAAFAGTSSRHSDCASVRHPLASHRGMERDAGACPCLAAGCCCAPAGEPPVEGGTLLRAAIDSFPADLGSGGRAIEPERRPLALFARAGQSPPAAT